MMLLQGSTITPLRAGRIDARVRVPAGTGACTLLLAEPADGGWKAELNGRGLKARTIDGWAQGYDVPPSGGEVTLTRGMLMRHTWLVVQGVAVLLVAVLALPGARADTLMPGGDRNRERRERRGRRARRGVRGVRGGHRAGVRHEPAPAAPSETPETPETAKPPRDEPAPASGTRPEPAPGALPAPRSPSEAAPEPVASEEQS
jgi:hypothetical protein